MQAILKKTTRRRPISLTILGWFFIIFYGGQLTYLFWTPARIELLILSADRPWGLITDVAIPIISAVLSIAAGIAILLRRKWGRAVYVGTMGVGLVIWEMQIPMKEIVYWLPGPLLLFVLFIYLLYRKPATAYFQRTKVVADDVQDAAAS